MEDSGEIYYNGIYGAEIGILISIVSLREDLRKWRGSE
jgi:hypothetical protein